MKTKYDFKRIEGVESDRPIHVMVLSFLYALVFGLTGIFPMWVLKDVASDLSKVIAPTWRGSGAVYIIATMVFALVLLCLFCVLWHKLEKRFHPLKSLLTSLKWTVIAAIVGVIALLGDSWLTSMIKPV